MTKLVNLRQQSTETFEQCVKTFTDILEKFKASGSPLEESNAVIMFLNSVDASPFRPKTMKLLGRTPLPDLERCM